MLQKLPKTKIRPITANAMIEATYQKTKSIYLASEPSYVGQCMQLLGNHRSPAQIEFCKFRDKKYALKAYQNNAYLIREDAKKYGTLLTLGVVSRDDKLQYCIAQYLGMLTITNHVGIFFVLILVKTVLRMASVVR